MNVSIYTLRDPSDGKAVLTVNGQEVIGTIDAKAGLYTMRHDPWVVPALVAILLELRDRLDLRDRAAAQKSLPQQATDDIIIRLADELRLRAECGEMIVGITRHLCDGTVFRFTVEPAAPPREVGQ